MKTSTLKHALMAAAALLIAPAAASAQSNIAEKAEEVTQQAQEVTQQADQLANSQTETDYVAREERDRDGFDWGLLGLLGLAGLLGLKKKDDDRDIHVDARRDGRS